MTDALVITAAALQRCLERAGSDWINSLRCPDDCAWDVLSIVDGRITFVLARDDTPESSRAVIISQNGGLLGRAPADARREILQRVHRCMMAAANPPFRLPVGWSVFHYENLVAFFACRREFGAWRWIAEINPRNSSDTGFWRLTHTGNEFELETFRATPEYHHALKIYDEAISGWRRACAAARERFDSMPSTSGPQSIVPSIDLEATTFGAVTKHRTYSAWMDELTPKQREFVTHARDRSLKLRGPAGSGKTLALELKALHELYRAIDAGQQIRILFATHSWSTAVQVDRAIMMLDERGLASSIDIYPLLEIARDRLPREQAHGALGLLGHDSLEGKRLQLERIDSVVSRLRRGDWLAYRDKVTPELRAKVEAEPGSPERNLLVWDLMMEFASVLGAQGIFPGVSAERRYLALPRADWMMPLRTTEERRFVLRVYTDYVNELRSEGVLTSDQLVNDFLSYLETFTWNARRSSEGYDLVFVDELHLFSEQERLVLNYLTRSADEYPRIFMAVDPRQAPSEVYGFAGAAASHRESGEAEQQLGDVESLDLREIHRFSTEILEFIRHIHQSYPTLDFQGEDWAFESEALRSSVGSGGSRPTLVVCSNAREEIARVLERAGELASEAGADERVAIALLDVLRLDDYEKAAKGSTQPTFVVIRSRDDVDRLRYSRRSIVLSAAEYVAGLQFSRVIVAGFPRAEFRGPNTGYQLRRFLSAMYLAVSRASNVVELFANQESGELPDVLESAVRKQLINRKN